MMTVQAVDVSDSDKVAFWRNSLCGANCPTTYVFTISIMIHSRGFPSVGKRIT
jgi:hypothetical protein